LPLHQNWSPNEVKWTSFSYIMLYTRMLMMWQCHRASWYVYTSLLAGVLLWGTFWYP
jgi:hypothetical protein